MGFGSSLKEFSLRVPLTHCASKHGFENWVKLFGPFSYHPKPIERNFLVFNPSGIHYQKIHMAFTKYARPMCSSMTS